MKQLAASGAEDVLPEAARAVVLPAIEANRSISGAVGTGRWFCYTSPDMFRVSGTLRIFYMEMSGHFCVYDGMASPEDFASLSQNLPLQYPEQSEDLPKSSKLQAKELPMNKLVAIYSPDWKSADFIQAAAYSGSIRANVRTTALDCRLEFESPQKVRVGSSVYEGWSVVIPTKRVDSAYDPRVEVLTSTGWVHLVGDGSFVR